MVKLIDIAKEMSLSRVTVSAVLNDRYKALGISEATAERVRKTAEQMGYQQNLLSQAMRTGRTFNIGCIMSERRPMQWIAEIIVGILAATRERGYSVRIEEITEMGGRGADALGRLVGQQVEGIIGVNIEHLPAGQEDFRSVADRYDIPMVGINCVPDFSPAQVEPGNEEGSRLAVDHLVRLGHQRIGFIGGNPDSSASQERKLGYINSLAEFGLTYEPDLVREYGWDIDDGELCADELLRDRASAPTALLTASDVLGATAQRVARAFGYHLPDDLSVAAFSNTVASACANPQLTVIDMNYDHVGMKAADVLMDHIDLVAKGASEAELPARTVCPVQLVRRESTSRPGKAGKKTFVP